MTTNNPLQSIQTPDLLQERLARLKAEFPDLFTNEGQLNPTELLRLTGQQGREHFDFQWWGKAAAKRKALLPLTAVSTRPGCLARLADVHAARCG